VTILSSNETNDLMMENEELRNEIEFLRIRNTDLRKKTYIQVYDENLKLIDENKFLKNENKIKFNDLVKYEKTIEQLRKELIQVGQIADKYFQDAVELGETNRKLRKVVQSVEKFVKQFA
jgi:chromosome condensin MukBEF MukE localization factor